MSRYAKRTIARREMLLDSGDEARMLLLEAHEALDVACIKSPSLPAAVRCGEVAGKIARFLKGERDPG